MLRTIGAAFAPLFYLVSPYDLALREEDSDPAYLEKAIPIFFVMMSIEALVNKIVSFRKNSFKSSTNYFTADTFASTFLGATQIVLQMFLTKVGLNISNLAYSYVWENFRVVTYDVKEYPLVTYIGLLFGTDFAYYWYHRLAHEFHGLWAGHNVHHSGQVYNMATALRQGTIQPLTSPLSALPLALFFPPSPYRAHANLNTLYQYWIHTEVVGRLGPLEYVLNTPMAHRMHHRPPGNCNYAGVLIIWDRIFGTYQAEQVRKDFYGLAAPATTFCPLQLNLNHWRVMRRIPRSWPARLATRRAKAKWICQPSALLEPIPPQQDDKRPDGPVFTKLGSDVHLAFQMQLYLIVAGVLGLVALSALLFTSRSMALSEFVLLLAVSLGHIEVMSSVFTNPSKHSILVSLAMFAALMGLVPMHAMNLCKDFFGHQDVSL